MLEVKSGVLFRQTCQPEDRQLLNTNVSNGWRRCELKKRITIRAVDEEVVDMLRELREEEGRFIGRILSDAVREYWETQDEEVDSDERLI